MQVPQVVEVKSESEDINKINTTSEEIEAYYIVKSIIRTCVKPDRIGYKDTQSYFSIQLDNNVRRQICRLYLNSAKKSIAFFEGEDKKEVKFPLINLEDLYTHSDRLRADAEKITAK